MGSSPGRGAGSRSSVVPQEPRVTAGGTLLPGERRLAGPLVNGDQRPGAPGGLGGRLTKMLAGQNPRFSGQWGRQSRGAGGRPGRDLLASHSV